MKKNILLYFILFTLSIINAQDYYWDYNFGNNGLQTIGFNNRNTRGQKIINLPDGSFILGINSSIPQYGALFDRDFYVCKLNENGEIETSFATNGFYHVAGNYFQPHTILYDIEYSPIDGYIYILGLIAGENKLFRIDLNGNLDNYFAENGFFKPKTGRLNGLAIDFEGRIVLSGAINMQQQTFYKIVRLLPDGQKDNSFNRAGELVLDATPLRFDLINKIHIQPDNKIVTVGSSYQSNNAYGRGIIGRLDANGNLDITFGQNGFFDFPLPNQYCGVGFNDLDITANGEIYAAGYLYHNNGTGGFFGVKALIIRLKQNGQLDFTYNQSGYKIFFPTVAGANNRLMTLKIIDNHILAGGSTASLFPSMQTYYYLVMTDKDGNFVSGFFNNGVLATDLNGYITNYVFDIAGNNNGDIFTVGIYKEYNSTFFRTIVGKLSNNQLFLHQADKREIRLFPNPVKDYLHLLLSNLKVNKIDIFSFDGQLILNLKPNNNHVVIDLSQYKKGMYWVFIEYENGRTEIKKIIKQ